MKKKLYFLAVAALLLTGCSDSKDSPVDYTNEKDEAFAKIAQQYVDNTVIATYGNLAESADRLVADLNALRADKTDANVQAACKSFLEARAWWEKSEAFLFGPAGDFGIDPHIDTWPLDIDGLTSEMNNSAHIAAMSAEDGDIWAGSHLGPELLGFHGIEYIIFADGQPRAAASIPDNQIIYACAVAGDLRNCSYQLHVSWAGEDNVPAHQAEKINDLEWNCTVSGTGLSYRENMLNAGKGGSIYRSMTDAMQAIADGCASIADEVGTQKIGKPHTGEDSNYIESPYSHKSIVDFYDNVTSIENAYMGGIEGRRNTAASLHAYLEKANPELDARCVKAIENAHKAINSMAAPFVLNYRDASAGKAIEALRELEEVLTEVKAEVAK